MTPQYRWDSFVLDLDAFRLEKGGVPLGLEPKALNLLALMVRRPGHLFTKQEIFEAVWPDTAVTDHALTRVIAQIRRVLGDEAREGRYLVTVPTKGYRWIHPVEEVPSPPSPVAAPLVPVSTGRRLSPFIGAGVAVAMALLVVLVWERQGTSSESEPSVDAARQSSVDHARDVQWPIQMTTSRGLDFHPTLSPHGDAVAFVSDRTGSFEIYVRALDGRAIEMPLTSDGAQNVQPAWSPDGRYLAYHSYRHGGVWIVSSRGGPPKQIVTEGSKPAWSPDGARIAYQSDEHTDASPHGFGAQNGSTIRMVDADGTHVSQLTHSGAPAGGHAAPAWSPDGRYVSFAVFDAGPENGVWLLNRQTGATTMLQEGDDLFESVFSPDGSTIYIAGGEALIARLRFDPASGAVKGRGIIPVPGVPGVRGLSISPDGSQLAFAGLGLSSQIWAQRVSRDGTPAGEAKALTSDTSRRNSLPAISPDGTRVAYMSSRKGEHANVWVMDADGSDSMQLTSDTAFESPTEWFPDGTRLAYRSRGEEDEGLRFIDVTTRRTEDLVDFAAMRRSSGEQPPLSGQLAELRLSRSTALMAFSMRVPPNGNRVLYVTPRDAISPRALTDSSLSAGYPAWSPDERSVAIEIKEGSSTHAGVVDADTGVLRRLTSARGQTWVRSWSPDSRKIAAAVLRDGRWSVRAFDVANGNERVITQPGPPRVYVRYPDWSPRGDLIVFERAEMSGNIWTIRVR